MSIHAGFEVLILLLDLLKALIQLHIFLFLERRKNPQNDWVIHVFVFKPMSVAMLVSMPQVSPVCRSPSSSFPAGGAVCFWYPAPLWDSPALAPDTVCGSPSAGTNKQCQDVRKCVPPACKCHVAINPEPHNRGRHASLKISIAHRSKETLV